MTWALVEFDLQGDKHPDGSQQRFAKRHSLFSSFAWVELGLACRSALQAARKSVHRDFECIPPRQAFNLIPSPWRQPATSHLHITWSLCSALPRLPAQIVATEDGIS